MFFWFYRSIGFDGNIKFTKKRNYVSRGMGCQDSFHFCYATSESDGALIQFVDQVMWCLQSSNNHQGLLNGKCTVFKTVKF